MVDVLFVQLGIYEHFWYRSVFTLTGFFIYGLIVKYWYKRFFCSMPSNRIYYPTLFLSSWSVSANLVGTLLKVLGLRVFQSAFYPDPSRNHTAAALIYGPVMIIIMMALYKWRSPWWQKAFVFLLLLVCQWGLIQSRVMVVRPGWEIVVLLFDLAAFYGWTVTMDRFLQCRQNLKLSG